MTLSQKMYEQIESTKRYTEKQLGDVVRQTLITEEDDIMSDDDLATYLEDCYISWIPTYIDKVESNLEEIEDNGEDILANQITEIMIHLLDLGNENAISFTRDNRDPIYLLLSKMVKITEVREQIVNIIGMGGRHE